MTQSQYATWAETHASLLGMRSQDDARLFALWSPILLVFTLEELRAASYAVAQDLSGRRRWRENHLSMLCEAILAKRSETAARERERFDREIEAAECSNCHGVGVVRVPSPESIVDNELKRGLFTVVACCCVIGVTRFNAVNGKLAELEDSRRMIDLREYESIVPQWREITSAYHEVQARQFHVAAVARQADRVAPIIVERSVG